MATRKKIRPDVRLDVLTEAGYRCAVPTCRTILAIDLHHIVEVAEGGPDEVHNLLAMCPTCHALYNRGVIASESIRVWKTMLLSLSRAFDTETIDKLQFLKHQPPGVLRVSGDGVLQFHRLIAAGLAEFVLAIKNGPFYTYEVKLTSRGVELVDAWEAGQLDRLHQVLGPAEPARA